MSRDVVDRMGAGDAYLAVTAPCVAAGMPLDMVGARRQRRRRPGRPGGWQSLVDRAGGRPPARHDAAPMTSLEPGSRPRSPAGPGAAPPRVTVAVSTWNRAHLVGARIASVLAQTFDGHRDPRRGRRLDRRHARGPRPHRRPPAPDRPARRATAGSAGPGTPPSRLARGEWLAFSTTTTSGRRTTSSGSWPSPRPAPVPTSSTVARGAATADGPATASCRRRSGTGRSSLATCCADGSRWCRARWYADRALRRRSAGLDEELKAVGGPRPVAAAGSADRLRRQPDVLVVRHDAPGRPALRATTRPHRPGCRRPGRQVEGHDHGIVRMGRLPAVAGAARSRARQIVRDPCRPPTKGSSSKAFRSVGRMAPTFPGRRHPWCGVLVPGRPRAEGLRASRPGPVGGARPRRGPWRPRPRREPGRAGAAACAAGARPTLTLAPVSRRGGSGGLPGAALTHGSRPAASRSAKTSGSSGHFGRGMRVNGTPENTSGGAT